MSFTVGIRIALEALGRNKLRTLLAMLGLIIGVAAVVTMVALGNGAQAQVEDEVQRAGTNLVFVTAGNYTRGGDAINIPSGLGKATTLTKADADAIGALPGVRLYTPEVNERAPFVAGDRRSFGPVRGVDATLPEIYAWTGLEGRFFGASEVSTGANVVVLGRDVRDALFGPNGSAVGRSIDVRGTTFEVVGVSRSQDPADRETIFVPYPALQRLLDITYLHRVVVEVTEAGEASDVADAITTLLRERHGIVGASSRRGTLGAGVVNAQGVRIPDDFTVRTQATQALTQGLYTSAAAFVLASMPSLDEVTSEEMASTLQHANQTMTVLLASIAGVSLVVGGLGIMNIMLLAVTERTREIGVRLAVGARTRDVLLQFLLEAVTLSVLGGVAGVAAGFLVSGSVTRLLEWPTLVSTGAVGLAFSLSVAVGIFFGYYPAQRASRLDPIDALRHE